jgi:hypothetical protein
MGWCLQEADQIERPAKIRPISLFLFAYFQMVSSARTCRGTSDASLFFIAGKALTGCRPSRSRR